MVYGAKTFFSENFAEYWLYFIGGLFMAVVVFLPTGLAGLLDRWRVTARPRAKAVPVASSESPPDAPRPRWRHERAAGGRTTSAVSFDGFRRSTAWRWRWTRTSCGW